MQMVKYFISRAFLTSIINVLQLENPRLLASIHIVFYLTSVQVSGGCDTTTSAASVNDVRTFFCVPQKKEKKKK